MKHWRRSLIAAALLAAIGVQPGRALVESGGFLVSGFLRPLLDAKENAGGGGGGFQTTYVSATKVNGTDGELEFAPVRGLRGSTKVGEGSEKIAPHIGNAKCGVTYYVNSESDKYARCPDACPYYAQNKEDSRHCTFVCVPGEQCHVSNPSKPIPDKELGVCRAPMVQACLKYNLDPNAANPDSCLQCQSGYRLGGDGQCYYRLMPLIYSLAALLVLVAVVGLVWLLDLGLRASSNPRGLREGLEQRESMKLRTQGASTLGYGSEGSPRTRRHIWPLRTNLCTTDVAGPGLMLHFNFQAVVMIWAVMVGLGWAALAFFVDESLWVLGTRKFGTPRENCILVAWGYETQQRLMWTKLLFCLCVYLGSFVLALLHSVRQLRLFQTSDFEHTTMKDFVVMFKGLPRVSGNDRVETELAKAVHDQTKLDVVGVSVAWDFKDKEDFVMKAIDDDADQRNDEYERKNGPREPDEAPEERVGFRQKLYELELKVFGPGEQEEDSDDQIENVLKNMSSSTYAFAVFHTQRDRDKCVAKLEVNGGLKFRDETAQAKLIDNEPSTVQWASFGNASPLQQTLRLLQGFGFILLGLALWVVVFYAPYAWSVYTFNYDNGQQPGMAYSISFSMVVVIGNVIMYEICTRVSEYVGFKFKDDKEACYMVLYLVACSLNIALDMLTTYITAWEVMTALGFRTHAGERLHQVPMFPEGFETYAIQRNLAENLFAYAFPSTYLIPFLIEPLPTIILPRLLGMFIVRTHREIRRRDAEELLASAPLELGRYADILLNMVLGIGIFYFPGGYTAKLFFFMACSHLFIYAFDHYRVLRVIPTTTFASMSVDWWSQAMLAPLCGTVLACLVFKANNQPGYYSLDATSCVLACSAAFVLHTVVHVLLLVHVVPRLGRAEPPDDDSADVKYSALGTETAASYFSTNPVHCLRSEHIYGHSPPCDFWVTGKEHLMRLNKSIGCHFKCEKVSPSSEK